MSTESVVVTGLGMTDPVGGDVRSSWAALCSGTSGARALQDEAYADLPVRIAAPARVDPASVLRPVEARRLDRNQQLAIIAAREAWADAGLSGTAAAAGLDPLRVGADVGSGIGGISTILSQYDNFRHKGQRGMSPYTVTMTMPNGAVTAVSLEVGARSGSHAPVSACATGAEAIGQAAAMIRSGRCDLVVAGGAEAAIQPFTLGAFGAMRALSRRNEDPRRASRPFDADRDGFVLGEGAGILVLESRSHALARGARIYARLAGAGFSSDAYHVARSDPDGTGAIEAMHRALAEAGAEPDQVMHINAHATSTPAGDQAEAVAIRKAFSHRPLVTSTKSMTGHLLGGAGAIEAILTILALTESLVPPTINLDRLDPEVDLDIATEARELPKAPAGKEPLALSNSFGFGGHNVSLAFRRD